MLIDRLVDDELSIAPEMLIDGKACTGRLYAVGLRVVELRALQHSGMQSLSITG